MLLGSSDRKTTRKLDLKTSKHFNRSNFIQKSRWSWLVCVAAIFLMLNCQYAEAIIARPSSITGSITGMTVKADLVKTRRSLQILAQDNQQTHQQSAQLSVLELAICGAFASMVGDLIMHPVDTVKVFQQTSKAAVSLVSAAAQIWSKSGFLGFYPGVGPYVIADGISGAIKFAAFEVSKAWTENRIPIRFHPISRFVCAAGAMLACSFTLVPGEVIKVRLQEGSYGGLLNLISTTFKAEGIGGFFAGYFATLVRDVPYTMLELGLYENLKAAFRVVKKTDLNQQDELVCAAITGGVTAILTTPLDLVKTKLMVQSASGPVYTGVWDALQSVYAAGGFPGLFVGASARVAWLLPFTMIYLPVYEIAKRNIARLRRS